MRKPRVIKQIEESAPPVPAAEALRRNLLHRMFSAVSGEDVDAIVRKQVEKATSGDSKAARLILSMIQTANEPTVTINNDNRGQVFLSEVRLQIVHVLRAEGKLDTVELARRLNTTQDRVRPALDHDWFEKEADGWHLTSKAMAEVCEPMEES